MGPIFECSYTHTLAMDREYYRYWFFKRPFMVVLYALVLLGFLSGVADFILFFRIDAALILPPLTFGLMYLTYRRTINSAQKRCLEVTNGEGLKIQISMTPDKILYETSVSGRSRELSLGSIRKAVNLKSQIVLVSDAKMLYSFRKDSFTKGTAMKLEAFLKQKGLLR